MPATTLADIAFFWTAGSVSDDTERLRLSPLCGDFVPSASLSDSLAASFEATVLSVTSLFFGVGFAFAFPLSLVTFVTLRGGMPRSSRVHCSRQMAAAFSKYLAERSRMARFAALACASGTTVAVVLRFS
jgi:hypothetical protein